MDTRCCGADIHVLGFSFLHALRD